MLVIGLIIGVIYGLIYNALAGVVAVLRSISKGRCRQRTCRRHHSLGVQVLRRENEFA